MCFSSKSISAAFRNKKAFVTQRARARRSCYTTTFPNQKLHCTKFKIKKVQSRTSLAESTNVSSKQPAILYNRNIYTSLKQLLQDNFCVRSKIDHLEHVTHTLQNIPYMWNALYSVNKGPSFLGFEVYRLSGE